MLRPDEILLRDAVDVLSGYPRIYWIIGGSVSGKTTVCRWLAEERGLPIYDMDSRIYGSYIPRYTPQRHPASHSWFHAEKPLEWVLSLSWEEFDALNRAATLEQLDLFAEDVAAMPANRPLVVDGGITHPSQLTRVVPPERVFCLALDSAISANAWNTAPERTCMKDMMRALPDPEAAWTKFLDHDRRIHETILEESREAGAMVGWRAGYASVEELAVHIKSCFGL
jgi:hypothetical protein